MKVVYQTQMGATIEQDVADTKKAFAFLAVAQEIFGVKKCGNCGSPNVRLLYRTPQGYEFYSVKCDDCGHELKFGQQKETGRLFPKGWEPPYEGDEDDRGGRPQSRRPPREEPTYQYGPEDEDDYNTPPPRGSGSGRADDIPF